MDFLSWSNCFVVSKPDTCKICGEYHDIGGYECPENPYSWPYSNKCPRCQARAMVGDKCTACGVDQHQEQCPECGTWQNHHHFEQNGGSGCVTCVPRRAEEQRQREAREREERHDQYSRKLQIVGAGVWKGRK